VIVILLFTISNNLDFADWKPLESTAEAESSLLMMEGCDCSSFWIVMLEFIPSKRDCTAEEQAARLLKSGRASGRGNELSRNTQVIAIFQI